MASTGGLRAVRGWNGTVIGQVGGQKQGWVGGAWRPRCGASDRVARSVIVVDVCMPPNRTVHHQPGVTRSRWGVMAPRAGRHHELLRGRQRHERR
eukprot:349677-Chlamydomonas_euryale.AAC.1